MGQIHVDGIGIVEIAGDTPTEEESRAIAAGVGGAPAAPERSFGERMLRQVGLGARAIAHGVTQLPALAGDTINAGVNLGIRGVNAATGAQIPELGRMSDVVNRGIDAVTPAPENATERIVQRVGSDLVSLATGGAAARAIGATGPIARRVADVVTARPVAQTVATVAMSGGGAGGREMLQDADPPYPPGAPRPNLSMGDVGDIAGTVAGAAAGTAVPALANVGGRVLAPLTQAGREQMIAQTQLNNSTDPQTLYARLMSGAREIVPGSQRTTAEVAADPGLMGVERGVRNMGPRPGGEFAERDAERTAARRTAVDAMAPGRSRTTAFDAGQQARTGLAAEREGAAANVAQLYQGVPGNIGAFDGQQILTRYILPAIGPIYQDSTAFAAAVRAAGQNPNLVQTAIAGMDPALRPILERLHATNRPLRFGEMRAMDRELGEIAGIAARDGNHTLAGAAGRVREAIDVATYMGLPPQYARQHARALAARRAMGAAYDEGAVGTALGRNQYGRLPDQTPTESIPGTLTAGPTAVRQLETAANGNPRVMDALRGEMTRRLRDAIETPGARGATNETTDSAARFHNFLRDNADAIRTLYGPQGFRNLATIGQDFASRQMVDTVGRAVGSNTAQNLSVANVLAEAFGGLIDPRRAESHPLMRAIRAPYRWLGVEDALRETLTRATLDPDFATVLASRATPQMMRRAVSLLNQDPSGWATAGRVAGMAGRAVRGAVGPLTPGALNAAANRSPEDQPPIPLEPPGAPPR